MAGGWQREDEVKRNRKKTWLMKTQFLMSIDWLSTLLNTQHIAAHSALSTVLYDDNTRSTGDRIVMEPERGSKPVFLTTLFSSFPNRLWILWTMLFDIVHSFVLASRHGSLVGQPPSSPYVMVWPTALSLTPGSVNIIPWNTKKLDGLTRPSNFNSHVLGRGLNLGLGPGYMTWTWTDISEYTTV